MVQFWSCFSRRLGGSIIYCASLGVLAVQVLEFAWRFQPEIIASGPAVQLERILLLQVELDQAGSSLVNFRDLRAHP